MHVYSIQCNVYSITVLVPALPLVSVSELSPKLGKETCTSLSIIISCPLLRPIGSKILLLTQLLQYQYGTRLFQKPKL